VLSPDLVKGPWQKTEDEIIKKVLLTNNDSKACAHLCASPLQCKEDGMTKWSEIAKHIPGRVGKQVCLVVFGAKGIVVNLCVCFCQCRERWLNHLDPELKHGAWTDDEDRILILKQAELGNKWSKIASFIVGRPENAVKNRWWVALSMQWRILFPDFTALHRNSFEHKKMMKMLKEGGQVTGDVSAAMRARVEKRAARSRCDTVCDKTLCMIRFSCAHLFACVCFCNSNKGARGAETKPRARPKPPKPSYSLANSPRDGFGLGLMLNVDAANDYDGELGLPSLPTPMPLDGNSVGNDDDVEMTLDALAALTPPTPSFFSDLGDWKWPRSCRTPRDHEGALLMIPTPTTCSSSKQVAEEGKRMYNQAVDGPMESPSKKQRTPKGFTPRGATPRDAAGMSSADAALFAMEEVRIR
jgi:hypothetical protein